MQDIEKTERVLQYIERHLDAPLDLGGIAGAACVSPFHLHRVFRQTVGLTIHDYLRRRQITEAARRLVESDLAVLDIALDSGYGSQQAFTAVFKAMYKKTPAQFRRAREFYPLQLPLVCGAEVPRRKTAADAPFVLAPAGAGDVFEWMRLVRLVLDGYPCFNEDAYRDELCRRIAAGQALVAKSGRMPVGVMLSAPDTGRIDFLGVHPCWRKTGVYGALVDAALAHAHGRDAVSITTYRAGDRADTGYRRTLQTLGFIESGLLVEFGYPTQEFVLARRAGSIDHV